MAVVGVLGSRAQDQGATLFPYPSIPDSITSIPARYDYFVGHFWDHAPMNKVFSSRERLALAFDDFISPMRFTSGPVVLDAVSRLMKSVEKEPEKQLFFANLAENRLYGDSAELLSDKLYMAFIRPVLSNKKVDKASRERYRAQVIQLSNSQPGAPMPAVPYTDPDGQQRIYEHRDSVATIFFFNDPDCMDCTLARARLNADIRANELLDSGELDIVAISPVDADDAWKATTAGFNKKWIVGANPDADMLLDLRFGTPAFYIVDQNGILVAKNMNIEALLQVLGRI